MIRHNLPLVVFSMIIVLCRGEVVSLNNTDHKIVGGLTTVEAVPYQISLQGLNYHNGQYIHFCGGSILTEKHIVTAAHCLEGWPVENITVVVGTAVWDVGGVRHAVDKYEIHERYEMLETCDIGIITLTEPLEFNDKVQPIAFNDNYVPGNVPCIVTGWGYTFPIRAPTFLPYWFISFFRLYPKDLQIAQLRTITNGECRRQYLGKELNTELCTYVWSKGACAGDSGGPVVNMKQNLLIGIVSFGSSNCGGFTGTPDGHTRVSNFTTWIQERIKIF
ncbi:trypsin-like [Bradysia coprophila]|uniref:trypsin-like n=1 Tax=Bradysia coprophila TaxID=38358 RepID=UPI00187DD382|nr:trypsin-like [Bradysia coprophila]